MKSKRARQLISEAKEYEKIGDHRGFVNAAYNALTRAIEDEDKEAEKIADSLLKMFDIDDTLDV